MTAVNNTPHPAGDPEPPTNGSGRRVPNWLSKLFADTPVIGALIAIAFLLVTGQQEVVKELPAAVREELREIRAEFRSGVEKIDESAGRVTSAMQDANRSVRELTVEIRELRKKVLGDTAQKPRLELSP